MGLYKYLWIALLSLGTVFAAEQKTLVLLTDDGPPHMIKDIDGGIDIDITRQILNRLGYTVNIEYVPLGRAMALVKVGQADLTVPSFFSQDADNAYVSNAIIDYRPTIFTRIEEQHQFTGFSDIKNLHFITFQGAKGYFGKPLEEMSRRVKYTEMPDMSVFPKLLNLQRADAVLVDYYIFQYYAKTTLNGVSSRYFKAHSFIPAVSAHATFADEGLRDQFNQELAKYLAEGKQQSVVQEYIGQP